MASRSSGRGGGGRSGRTRGGASFNPMGARPNRKSTGGKNTTGGSSKSVYVGNLSWSVTWQILKDHLRSLGITDGRVEVTTSADGRSKGWGLVAFDSAQSASNAVRKIHDTKLHDRLIFAREDREEGMSGVNSRSIYVGNLPWEVTWQHLKDAFNDFGPVEYADVATEGGKPGGRSYGWGTVRFKTDSAVQKAISSMNGREMDGRVIEVRIDNKTSDSKTSSGPTRQSGASGGGGGTSIYVGNLPWEVKWQDLKDTFAKFGSIEYADIATEGGQPGGRSQGWGTVRYRDPASAKRAIREMNGRSMDGREIEVRFDVKEGGIKRQSSRSLRQTAGSANSAIYVGNLPWNVAWQDLKDTFAQFGTVEYADVATEGGKPGGRSHGWGTVRYSDAAAGQRAIREMNGREMDGRIIEVRVDEKAGTTRTNSSRT
jgi:RNA recognition motif-containing protein|eukprot:Stramenopile-MAST_4_protein_1218